MSGSGTTALPALEVPEAFENCVVSVDGILVGAQEAAVSVWDRGFLYGDGCFEGMRLRNDRIFRYFDHFERLARSARVLDIPLGLEADALLETIARVARGSELDSGHVRVVISRGVGIPGIAPSRAVRTRVVVMVVPWAPTFGHEPLRLIVSSVVRKAPKSIDAHIKSLNYLDSVLAMRQAEAAGADDALLLDSEGVVAEATAANVFVVSRGAVATPTTRAALAGITRTTIVDRLTDAGVPVAERDVTWGEVYAADECFLTASASVGVVAVKEIDGRALRAPNGPITRKAFELLEEAESSDEFSVPLPP